MKIRLRGEKRDEQRAATTEDRPETNGAGGLSRKANKRQFLKLLATGAGLVGAAGLGQAIAPARRVQATYTPGPSVDVVDHDLQVNGNLGIGRAPAPAIKLHVAGPTATFRVENTNLGGHAYQLSIGDSSVDALDITDASVGLKRVTIAATGKVGIGTVSPGQLLTLGSGGAIAFNNPDDTNYSFIKDTGPTGTTGLGFYVSSGIPDMFIKSTGNVGIGIAIPVEKLDVGGNVRVSGTISINGNLAIDSTGVAQKSYYAP